jgi:hypothetical protein
MLWSLTSRTSGGFTVHLKFYFVPLLYLYCVSRLMLIPCYPILLLLYSILYIISNIDIHTSVSEFFCFSLYKYFMLIFQISAKEVEVIKPSFLSYTDNGTLEMIGFLVMVPYILCSDTSKSSVFTHKTTRRHSREDCNRNSYGCGNLSTNNGLSF